MKRVLSIVFVLSILLSLLSGCQTEQAPYTPTGSALTMDDEPGGATIPQESNQSVTLTYYPDRTMNPLLSTDFTNRTLVSLLYQSLFTVDRNYTVSPLLCKNYRVSQDMKTYTFYIADATFTDGSRLTAEDVAASLLTARDSTYYGGRFNQISDITLSEDGGVTVKAKVPMENLPLLLDIPIIKATQLQENVPLGTGPYYLDISAQTPILRRNTLWWCGADTVITAPAVSLLLADSISGIRDDFEFNGLDLVCADPGSDRYADYRCDYELWDCETGIFLYLACNMESPAFSDPEVRAALTFGIDRDTLAADYYRGFARAASLPMSPQCPYYSATLAARYAYDPEKFTQIVASNSAARKEIVLLVNADDSLRLRVARAIADMLNGAGMKVTLSEKSTKDYQSALKKKSYDLYLGQTKLSPNMDLSVFFASKSALNYGGISDPAIANLCSESLANHGNYFTLHKQVMDDGRLCPILFRSYAVYATRGLLTGLTPSRDNVFYYTLGRTMENALLED